MTNATPIDRVDQTRVELARVVRNKEAAMNKASSEYHAAKRALDRYDLDKASTDGVTIETALLSYIDNKSNEIGVKYLRERLASDWAGSYVFVGGGEWDHTGQHTIGIAIPSNPSIDGLEATKRALCEIAPFVQPGAAASATRPFLADAKIFSIRDDSLSEGGSRYLALRGEEWSVIESRRFRDEPWCKGTLDDCLLFVQRNLSYNS